MRAPRFWDRGRGRLAGPLLAPAAAVWTAATRRRLARGAWHRIGRPVICVGNLTVGGTGKTPAVLAIGERLGARGLAVAVVTRGYGGRLEGPVRVDPRLHDADAVGDEALLLAASAPVWVGRDRAAAARAAVAEGAGAVVLDDGFQNPGLAKDVAIVVVDAEQGFGNGRVVPAGPLREPVADGVARADLVLVVGEGPDRLRAEHPVLATRPVMSGRIVPLVTGMPWQGLRVLAFAGIGRPEKVFATLRGLGADVVRTRSFGDHEPYGTAILERLAAEARSLGAQLVTTEKDSVRLPDAFRRQVLVLPVRMAIDDWRPFDVAVAPFIAPEEA
jgi:tetraacyldisaccharide 4'-kinase